MSEPHDLQGHHLRGLASLVGRQARRRAEQLRQAREIADALGLPREEQYAIRSALFGEAETPLAASFLAPSQEEEPAVAASVIPQLPQFVLEIARGAAHVAQFVRSFLAGQTPPAFELSPVALQALGEDAAPSPEVPVGQAGPVAIAVADDPTGDVLILRMRLGDPASGPVLLRLYRGREGTQTPPEPIASFELSSSQHDATQRLSRSEFTAVRIEVESRA